MKRFIILVTAIILVVAFFVFLVKMVGDANRIVYDSGTEIIDRRYTRPDTYELCYREQFENGIGVERWVVVSKEEYLAWEAEKND